MMSSGAPASIAARDRTPAVSQVLCFALGCGLITMALPDLSEMSVLNIAVERDRRRQDRRDHADGHGDFNQPSDRGSHAERRWSSSRACGGEGCRS